MPGKQYLHEEEKMAHQTQMHEAVISINKCCTDIALKNLRHRYRYPTMP